MPMYFTDELKQMIADGEDAQDLLIQHVPNVQRRFKSACNSLKKLMDDIQAVFPEATYYTASGGLNIVLGSTHQFDESSHQELLAIGASNGLKIGDGDF